MTDSEDQSLIVNRQSSLPLRVLLVEDSEDDARLVLRALRQGGYEPEYQRVGSAKGVREAIAGGEWDVVLSDYVMPGFGGQEALELVRASGKDVPFILVSGAVGEEAAVSLMKAGAHDYVMKDRLSRLAPAVARELADAQTRRSRREAEAALRASEERYRALAETSHDYILMVGPDQRIRYANTAAAAEFGQAPDAIVGKALHDLYPKAIADREWHNIKTVFESGNSLYIQNRTEFPRRELWLDTWLAPIRDEGGAIQSVVGISRNVTELIQIELALRASEERYRLLFEHAPIGIYRTTPDGRILMANPALIRMMGYNSFYELSLRNLDAEGFEPTYDRKQFRDAIERKGEVRGLEAQWVRRDGSTLHVRENARLTRDTTGKTTYYEGTIEDISDQRRIQNRLQRLNNLLRTYRTIGQLIIRQRDPMQLIQQTCNTLVQTRGYDYAWIALLQSAIPNSGEPELVFLDAAQTGFDAQFPELIQRLKAGDFPPCVREALAAPGATLRQPACTDRQPTVAAFQAPAAGLVARLEHGQRILGVINVALAPGLSADAEEQTLFTEIAADLAYALHALRLDHELKASSLQLTRSETRYRNLVELSPDAIVVHAQGLIVFANPAALRLAGADTQDQLVGRNLLDFVHPDSRELVVQRVKTMLSQGRQVPLAEEKFVRLDGAVIDVEVAAMPITFDDPAGPRPAILVAFRDVTQRKQADIALRQSEARYRLLFEATPIGIAVFHPDGVVLAVNQFMQDLTGFDYGDFKQLGIGAIFLDPDQRSQLLVPEGARATPAAGTDSMRNWEVRLKRKDGSVCYALLNVDRLQFAGATILLATARDITDRKNAEDRLLRLNQLYSVLSQVNQAFIREPDIGRLCNEACRILVTAGGYALAWVGIVDHDARVLKPIAVSGDESGFVRATRFPLDRDGIRGPTMTALKDGSAVVRADLNEAPPDMPVHTRTRESGYHSVAAFPLRIGDEVIGTLTIYAAKPGHVDEEQVRLLEALAADLSFALQRAQFEQLNDAAGTKKRR
jgi:PAS domain S-box-containing protein